MVYGIAIADLTPSIEYPGVSIALTERTENPDYLFFPKANLRAGP